MLVMVYNIYSRQEQVQTPETQGEMMIKLNIP